MLAGSVFANVSDSILNLAQQLASVLHEHAPYIVASLAGEHVCDTDPDPSHGDHLSFIRILDVITADMPTRTLLDDGVVYECVTASCLD
jgi:hypothetical protein